MGAAALMVDIKQIMTQGSNTERVIDPSILSTGRAITKAELRAEGVDVENIAKYAHLPDTAHVFCTFSGAQQLNTCLLTLQVLAFDESQNDNDILQTFNIEITSVTVSEVISEISDALSGNGVSDFLVELRGGRLQITARRAVSDIRIGELRVIDSRGGANSESVNDLSNPERLFNYFWPDARAVSRRGDLSPPPARDAYVTSQSVGVSQGEPRTSASLNRGLTRHAETLDKTSVYAEFDSVTPERVRLPLSLTSDPIDFTVDYGTGSSPAATWSSTSMEDPAGSPPVVNIEPQARRGGLSTDLPHTVSVLALRGVSIFTGGHPRGNARIVDKYGSPIGLVSPDSRRRGRPEKTDLDYGVPFISEGSQWRVVKSGVVMGAHLQIINPSPLSKYLAFPEGDPLIDESQFEVLGEEVAIETGFTRVDDVTLELSVAVPSRYALARVRIDGGDSSLMVREWVNDRRVIVSEVPDELALDGGYVRSARLSDLDDPTVNVVHISRGPLVNPNEWLYISLLGTAGPLSWVGDVDVYLEVDVSAAPDSINGMPVLSHVNASTDLDVFDSIKKGASPTARGITDLGAYTLKGAHEAGLGGMSLRHSVGAPYSTATLNQLLTRAHARSVNGPHARTVFDSLGGVTLQQLSEQNPSRILEQAGINVTVELSDANSFYAGDDYADGIDFFLYDRFRVTDGDERYRILRALTLRYATGTLGRDVTIHPETFTLTIPDVESATDLMGGSGFIDEHIGLPLLVKGYGVTPLLITIIAVESSLSARFKYLDTSNVFSGMTSGVVDLKLAPQDSVNDEFSRGATPSILIEGLDTVADRVTGPPAIEVKGARPLESYFSLGDWLSGLVPDGRKTFPVYEHNGVKFAQIPFSQDALPLSAGDLPPRLKARGDSPATSLGGKYWVSTGYSHPGEFPDFLTEGAAPSNSLGHIADFYYKVSSPGGASDLAYPSFKVESAEVIVAVQRAESENLVYGLMIPVPDHALNTALIRGVSREVMIPGSVEIMKRGVSVNKDRAYIDKAYLDNPSALDSVNVYASSGYVSPRLEVSVKQDYDEGTLRPSGVVESRSEHISDFGGMRASSRIEARHEYQDRDDADDDAVVVSEMSLSGGPGSIGLTASHKYDQASAEYLSLVTVYGGDESTSVMKDGLYITDAEARCEDIPLEEMTGFSHKHLAGDVAINADNVKRLSEELDAMKQREFATLRQLSMLSAAAHESLDMLRTANATIRSLRDVQYELSMALLMTMDNARVFDDSDLTVRQELIARAGGQLFKNIPHRLIKALHLSGHAVMTGLPLSSLPTGENLQDYFTQTAHTSALADGFEDDVPLKYDRPGYARTKTDGVAVQLNESIDPLVPLKPTTIGVSEAFYPLYVTYTHDRPGSSRENVSWTSALNELYAIIKEAYSDAVSDFGGLVSSVSPLFSFRPRSDALRDDLSVGVTCSYLMGVGYWSPTSVGHARKGSYLDRKIRTDEAGWFFTSTSTRRVGPEQVSSTSDMADYVTGAGRLLSRGTDIVGDNSSLYEDQYIIDQVSSGRDLIVGVTASPTTGERWDIKRASLLGYPQLFQNSVVVAPTGDTRVYQSFDEAKTGVEHFYCVDTSEESPSPLVPGMYEDNALGVLTLPSITTYGNDSLIVDLLADPPERLEDYKIVYCRAWCVARGNSQVEVSDRLEALGYPSGDPRINIIPLIDGDWVGIRTRLGMADFLKRFNSGNFSGPGQGRFSFNESVAGIYARSDRQMKTSKDPV